MSRVKIAPVARTPEQVLHDSLQEWNEDEFMELKWNWRAATRAIKDLDRAGYVITPKGAAGNAEQEQPT